MSFSEYAAGFFDGEGCVTASQTERGYARLQLAVGQGVKKPLLALRRRYGGAIYTDHGCHFAWKLHSIANMKVFLEDIRPYLLVKTSVVDLALELLDGMQPAGAGRTRLSDKERKRRNRIGVKMRKLNRAT